MNDQLRQKRLELPPRGKILRAVIDSDAFNETDDLYAIAWALLSRERFRVEAIYGEPFLNFRCDGIADAAEKSRREILALLKTFTHPVDCPVFLGACSTYTATRQPVLSPAVEDLLYRASQVELEGEPLYVITLGPLTSVASALMTDPSIIEKIVVVWMGYGLEEEKWRVPMCPNTMVDVEAARYVLNSGVPLIQIPGAPVSSHLITTIHDLEYYLSHRNQLCDFLLDRYWKWQKSWAKDQYAWSKSLWDVGAVAALMDPDWSRSLMVRCPSIPKGFGIYDDPNAPEYLRGDKRYPREFEETRDVPPQQPRHQARVVYSFQRNPIFVDLYHKLSQENEGETT